MQRAKFVDSHTEGEPTRVLIDGLPGLPNLTFADALATAQAEYDQRLAWTVREPRGSDVVVGAVLLPPSSPNTLAGVIFYNNVGLLGMCGHGTMGLVKTMAHLGRIKPGKVVLDTPVGQVTATLRSDGLVDVHNVPAYCVATGVVVDVPNVGKVTGDIAYGGNWFFLVESDQPFGVADAGGLLARTTLIRRAVNALLDPPEARLVDHVELFGPPSRPDCDSKNFVLCPGLAFDRSPCGTGLSAKLATLAASDKLSPGMVWGQESIVGTRFEGSYQWADEGRILPTITGNAWLSTEGELLCESTDPFPAGISLG